MDYGEMFKLWGGIAAIAVLISLVITVLGWMIAYFLQDEKLKAWTKNEFLQTFYSVVILAMLIPILLLANEITTAASSLDPQSIEVCTAAVDTPCHIALAENYLNVLFDNARYMNRELLLVGSWMTFWSHFSLGFGAMFEMWGSISISPAAGLSIFSESISTAFDMVIKSMLAMRLQEIFIRYIHQFLFPILLIVGVVFRMFFFTRKLGGLLMAIALSLYFIYPAVYVMGGFILFNFTGGTLNVVQFTQDSLKFPIGEMEDMSDEEIRKRIDGFLFSIPGIEDESEQQDALLIQLRGVGKYGELVEAMENNTVYTGISDTLVKIEAGDPVNETAYLNISASGDKCDLVWIGHATYEIGDVKVDSETGYNDVYVKRMFTGQFDLCRGIDQDLYGHEISETGKLGKFGAWVKNRWRFGYWRLITDSLKMGKWATSVDWLVGENGYLHNAAKLLVFTVFMPLIALMVTMVGIRVMSPLFGGDVEIALISRLI